VKTRIHVAVTLALTFPLISATSKVAAQNGAGSNVSPQRPPGPCDVYAAINGVSLRVTQMGKSLGTGDLCCNRLSTT
jgi:hypothetical protein